jgi:hypothetical protein
MEPETGADGFLTGRAAQGLFDRAVAHWNAGRFFEAHEDWEALWLEAEGARRAWLQGLIQFAAAFHHFGRGGASGFAKLARSAAERAGGYAGDTSGIDFAALWEGLRPWIAHGARVGAGADLRAGAPAAVPRIAYAAGAVPAPLPFEAEGEDAAVEGSGDDA